MKGGPATGPFSVDRGKAGSKHHLIVEVHAIPLATTVTGGNRNDVTQLIALIVSSASAAGGVGHDRGFASSNARWSGWGLG
jgi:hypothetical protein